ncbi:glycosyltransferase [Terribacillus sp. 179-K 1B1 HS]|uniref:glycosyltransferase family 2 protein n=1 Tax=Terribacillus sp. 179-K 1B1 HS TaxID=3142388 RepID=UPI00399F7C7E
MQEGVSVIMTFYNEELNWIKESISSILNQTHSNLELIIVCDNPDNEDLFNKVKGYVDKENRVKVFRNEENIGLAKSLNFAIDNAKFNYIARMDADDIAIENRISFQLSELKRLNADIVGSNCILINEEGKEIGVTNYPISPKIITRLLPFINCLAHPTWFAKKSLFTEVGGYFDYKCAQDYDFLLRANNIKARILNTDKNLLKYRVRSNSIGNSKTLNQFMTANHIRMSNKNINYDSRSIKNFNFSKESNLSFLKVIESPKGYAKVKKMLMEFSIPFRHKYGLKYVINLYQTRMVKLILSRQENEKK